MSWGKRIFSGIVFLPGLLFIIMGLRWLVDPGGIAPSLGMTLETGFGLSSQIGDLSAFFLVVGLSILLALVTRIRTWYYPAILLLLLAAIGRTIAWVLHGAAFVPQTIVFELAVATLLIIASRFLPERD